MTDRRSFFGCLAGLFAGLGIPGSTRGHSSSTCCSIVSTAERSTGSVDYWWCDEWISGLGHPGPFIARTTRVQVVGGEWVDCPQLGDVSDDGWVVIEAGRSIEDSKCRDRGREYRERIHCRLDGVCYEIFERPYSAVKDSLEGRGIAANYKPPSGSLAGLFAGLPGLSSPNGIVVGKRTYELLEGDLRKTEVKVKGGEWTGLPRLRDKLESDWIVDSITIQTWKDGLEYTVGERRNSDD